MKKTSWVALTIVYLLLVNEAAIAHATCSEDRPEFGMLILPSGKSLSVNRLGAQITVKGGDLICSGDIVAPSPISAEIEVDGSDAVPIAASAQFLVPDMRVYAITHDLRDRVDRARRLASSNQTLGDEFAFGVAGISTGHAIVANHHGRIVIPFAPLLDDGMATIYAPGGHPRSYQVRLGPGDDEAVFNSVFEFEGLWRVEIRSAGSKLDGAFIMRRNLEDLDAEKVVKGEVSEPMLRSFALACLSPELLSLEAYQLLDRAGDESGKSVLRLWYGSDSVCSETRIH